MSEKEVFRNKDALLDINDKPSFPHWLVLSIQHLFTMFGATVLVPLLIGLNPSIALFCSGVGTIVYLLCTSLSRLEFCFYHDDASFDEKLRLPGCRSGGYRSRIGLRDRFFDRW